MPFSILLLSYFLFHKILVWNGRCFKILKAFPGLNLFFLPDSSLIPTAQCSVGNMSFLSWILPIKAWRKMSFIFNLSSVKALHCSLMRRLTCCLRPYPSLLWGEKGKKASFSSFAASAVCWRQALWKRTWQQGCFSGSETRDWEKRVNVPDGGSGVSFCMLIFDMCVLLHWQCFLMEQREAISPSRFLCTVFPCVEGKVQVCCHLLCLGLVLGLRRWKCPGAQSWASREKRRSSAGALGVVLFPCLNSRITKTVIPQILREGCVSWLTLMPRHL